MNLFGFCLKRHERGLVISSTGMCAWYEEWESGSRRIKVWDLMSGEKRNYHYQHENYFSWLSSGRETSSFHLRSNHSAFFWWEGIMPWPVYMAELGASRVTGVKISPLSQGNGIALSAWKSIQRYVLSYLLHLYFSIYTGNQQPWIPQTFSLISTTTRSSSVCSWSISRGSGHCQNYSALSSSSPTQTC